MNRNSEHVVINGQELKDKVLKTADKDNTDLISTLIAIKSTLFMRDDVNLRKLDKRTRKIVLLNYEETMKNAARQAQDRGDE